MPSSLTAGILGDVLQFHVPEVAKDLHVFMETKGTRVWFALDQLVSGGKKLSPEKWIDAMGQRMAPEEEWMKVLPDGFDRVHRRARTESFSDMVAERSYFPRETKFYYLATKTDIDRGHEVLDKIEAANGKLRAFLLEKFKLEDVL